VFIERRALRIDIRDLEYLFLLGLRHRLIQREDQQRRAARFETPEVHGTDIDVRIAGDLADGADETRPSRWSLKRKYDPGAGTRSRENSFTLTICSSPSRTVPATL
jgi:hypothetical protein